MKNNSIDILKNKYFFIGFIVGIIPFIILLIILSGYKNFNSYKYVIIIISLITSLLNGYILKTNALAKLKRS